MIKTMIVKSDGVRYIGRIKQNRSSLVGVRGVQSWKSKKFDEYYYEAQYKNVPKNEISDYIQMRFWEEADDICNDTIDQKEFEELYKSFLNRLHKRLKRYKDKLFANKWSYWVTFTYDDEKETAEGFEKRLSIAFNNLAKRKGWRIIGGWENGELGGRAHFHAFVYVPEGEMIGDLFLREQYSTKRHKREIVTDNTYFNERFGNTQWISIMDEDLSANGLVNYLVKYVVKSGRKLFYSRGISFETEIQIDTEKNVLMSYYHHGFRYILTNIKTKLKILPEFMSDDAIDESNVFVFDADRCGFCDDINKLVIV